MTPERIDHIRRVGEDVLRLIHERELLLKACRAFVDRAKELNVPYTASELMARNALRIAEAP